MTHRRLLLLGVATLLAASLHAAEQSPASDLDWPAATRETRPWTRWWWLGSAVDKANLTRQLTLFKEAGLGGVEICPIYGVKGFEDRHIDFLSPQWVEMLAHTTAEAKRLGLGVDLTTGTGWPFGGPGVADADASGKVNLQRYELAGGAAFKGALPKGRLQCLRAVSDTGEQLDLTDRVKEGRLDWTAPAGRWRLYAAALQSPIQKVKRAAPGGAGNVLDPYSVGALDRYLAGFDKAFAGFNGEPPRAHFHDSFEYFGATWTTDLFSEFATRRGYDLRAQLPALLGDGPEDTVARVKADYRETISDLHHAYLRRWTDWAHGRGSLTRDQAHGSPGNLVDLYAVADIPETEIFGATEEKLVPMLKFASSAAHLTGRRLASAESFTWLGEHFQTTLAQAKQAADYLFLAGANHLFFHGIPYSPAEAAWPGWQFYASVNFGPQGGLWRDLPEFNAYLARCQSILQSGKPANDVLLYFPLHDLFHTPSDLLIPLTIHNVEKVLEPHPFHAAAMTLGERGHAYDHVSDRFLAEARCVDGKVTLGGNVWSAVVVPPVRVMPETTLRRLVQLARDGATIIVMDKLPEEVPGFGRLEARREALRNALREVRLEPATKPGIQRAAIGKGAFYAGSNLDDLLLQAGVSREPGVDLGLRLTRRSHAEGHHYFIANRGTNAVDGWVTLGTPAKSAAILDPRFENRAGKAALRNDTEGRPQVRLQLRPGESLVLRTFANKNTASPAWPYLQPIGEPRPVSGTWRVTFLNGGPELPKPFQTREPASWTKQGDAEAAHFHGTARYTVEFDHPAGATGEWLLDLGRVCESARVRLNGHALGALWCPPFQVAVGKHLRPGRNTLEIEVTNLAVNRIADLDRRKVDWKYFHEINFVNKAYKPFDASDWPPQDSGLIGPVTLRLMR